MLAVALSLSVIAAFYSIIGLAAIFAGAVLPIVIMGSILEVAKLTVTVWLHEYWPQVKRTMKLYLVPAVVILMLITSMGIFGFLSKAHLDQNIVSGEVTSKLAIYDEKIKTAKDNIDANRKALKQMDEAVDQVMGRSQDEKGADKAVALRRSQAKERTRLLSEIAAEQKTITQLSEERAPIAAEVRKVEAEVGPIKYIAALVYGDNPDANILEKAVRGVIILLVSVFDPLAIMMLLAATESMKWNREESKQIDSMLEEAALEVFKEVPLQEPEKSIFEKHPYLLKPFVHFKNLKPIVATPEPEINNANISDVEQPGDYLTPPDSETDLDKEAKRAWKAEHPNDTVKSQREKLARGLIDKLPWEDLLTAKADNQLPEFRGFGTKFPADATKGETFVRTDQIPSNLYKYNGNKWIEVDKALSDQYAYDTAYIDHLISRIESGEYDTELLNDLERQQVEQRLIQQTQKDS
jgi:hypothetical protein